VRLGIQPFGDLNGLLASHNGASLYLLSLLVKENRVMAQRFLSPLFLYT
jgi:hypothetical protein